MRSGVLVALDTAAQQCGALLNMQRLRADGAVELRTSYSCWTDTAAPHLGWSPVREANYDRQSYPIQERQ